MPQRSMAAAYAHCGAGISNHSGGSFAGCWFDIVDAYCVRRLQLYGHIQTSIGSALVRLGGGRQIQSSKERLQRSAVQEYTVYPYKKAFGDAGIHAGSKASRMVCDAVTCLCKRDGAGELPKPDSQSTDGSRDGVYGSGAGRNSGWVQDGV